MELATQLLKRYESLKNLRSLNFEERLEAMSFVGHRTKQASRSTSPVPNKILNTAVTKLAVDNFVNYFQGNLVSPNQPWLSLRYESNTLQTQDEMPMANEFVGRLQDAVSSELAASNFYPEHRLSCKDEYTGAASAMLIRNDPIRNICVFETLAPWEYWIDVDQYGEMDTFFYKRNMNLVQAYEMFEKLPEDMMKVLEEGNGYETYYDFLLCIYPRKKMFFKSIFAEEKKFASVWLALTSTTGQDSSGSAVVIQKSGLDYIPVVFNCWDRDGDNPYGTCPVMRSIEEVKKADILTYETFLSIQKINHQSWVGVAQSLENFSDDPGTRNYVQSMDLAPKPLEVNQTVDGAMQMQNDQYQVIQRTFNNDLFSYLSRQENSKVFTATQVNAVKAEQLALLSAVYGNFQKKIEKIVRIVVLIMAENGRLPEGSESLVGKDIQKNNTGKIRVIIDSTLSQELKAYTKRDANIAFLEQIAVFKNLQLEQALMNVDMNELIRGIGFGIGVDHKIIRDLSVVQQEQAAQQQLALAQMQQQQALTESEINRNNAGAANLNNATGGNQYQR